MVESHDDGKHHVLQSLSLGQSVDAHKVYEDDSLQVVQDSSEYTWVDETNKTTNVQKTVSIKTSN